MRHLLPTLLLVALNGCVPAPPASPSLALDATGMQAEEFIEEASAREFAAQAFFDEYGVPLIQDRDGGLLFLYECRNASVALTINRPKYEQGVVDVIEGEEY